MNLGELVRPAASLYGRYPLHFLSIAVIQLPLQLVFWLPDSTEWSLLISPISVVAYEFVFGALTVASALAASDEKPSFTVGYRIVLTRCQPVIGVTVRYVGITFLLAITIIGIPFAVARLVRWFFGLHGVVLRDLQPSEALDLSAQIVAAAGGRSRESSCPVQLSAP